MTTRSLLDAACVLKSQPMKKKRAPPLEDPPTRPMLVTCVEHVNRVGLCKNNRVDASTVFIKMQLHTCDIAPFPLQNQYIIVKKPKKKNKTKQDISSPAKFDASTSYMAPVYRTDSRFLTSTIAKGIALDSCFQHDMFGTQKWRASLETLHVGLHDQNVMFPL